MKCVAAFRWIRIEWGKKLIHAHKEIRYGLLIEYIQYSLNGWHLMACTREHIQFKRKCGKHVSWSDSVLFFRFCHPTSHYSMTLKWKTKTIHTLNTSTKYVLYLLLEAVNTKHRRRKKTSLSSNTSCSLIHVSLSCKTVWLYDVWHMLLQSINQVKMRRIDVIGPNIQHIFFLSFRSFVLSFAIFFLAFINSL